MFKFMTSASYKIILKKRGSFLFGLLGSWGVGELESWFVGLLVGLLVGELGSWRVGMLGGWFVGELECWGNKLFDKHKSPSSINWKGFVSLGVRFPESGLKLCLWSSCRFFWSR